MNVGEFQELMRQLYFTRDSNRGLMETFSWFVEEIGELSHELRQHVGMALKEPVKPLRDEFADVFAWLCSLANLAGIDLEEAAVEKYPGRCLKCNSIPCQCKKM